MRQFAKWVWYAMPMNWRTSAIGRVLHASYHHCVNGWEKFNNWRPMRLAHRQITGNTAKITVPHLEIHITHNCNLTCDGCVHFTNHRHSGTLSIDDLQKSMSLWNQRVVPKRFGILGGEPCLHRDLVDIVYMTREMWPHPKTKLEVVSNGLLLHLHPTLPQALLDTNTSLSISVHSDGSISPKYQEKISTSLKLGREWQRKYGIKFAADPCITWSRSYKGFGSEILPFEDNDHRNSWKNCITDQECFQLFEDRLWKCAPLAYLQLQNRKFNLSEKWEPYLGYQPLNPNCTDEEIVEFFSRKAESVCGMCPSNPQDFTKPDPLLPLTYYRKKKIPSK